MPAQAVNRARIDAVRLALLGLQALLELGGGALGNVVCISRQVVERHGAQGVNEEHSANHGGLHRDGAGESFV